MKGVKPEDLEKKVENAIKEVYLTKFTKYRTKELSGGMKRRLSVAISMIGDPKLVFLDEPSLIFYLNLNLNSQIGTGLDPENRR